MPHAVRNDQDNHEHPPSSRRPPLHPRQSSYSKRHASFDTPREIPLPRMVTAPLRQSLPQNNPEFDERLTSEHSSTTDSSGSVFSEDTPPDLSRASSMSSDHFPKDSDRFDHLRDRDLGYNSLDIQPKSSTVPPNSRPFSSPDTAQPHLVAPQPTTPDWPPDRSSTSSLPLPSYIPYHTLPVVPPTPEETQDSDTGPSIYRPPPMTRNSRTEPIPAWDHPPFYRSSSMPFDPEDPSSEGSFAIPPPEPPTILTPPPPSEPRGPAPHEPFLSHEPPPDNTWAAIETRPNEYRLVVRLPGFNRQSITIATRKRRILHIVADKWEDGGGHFERRVAYGYDADLGQVRAEFDGEHLLVRVPRRLPPVYVTNPKTRLR